MLGRWHVDENKNISSRLYAYRTSGCRRDHCASDFDSAAESESGARTCANAGLSNQHAPNRAWLGAILGRMERMPARLNQRLHSHSRYLAALDPPVLAWNADRDQRRSAA